MVIDKIIWEGKEIDSYDDKVIDEIIFDGEVCGFGTESSAITSSESDIKLEDATYGPLRSLKLVGESKQETYEGSNLFTGEPKYLGNITQSNEVFYQINADGNSNNWLKLIFWYTDGTHDQGSNFDFDNGGYNPGIYSITFTPTKEVSFVRFGLNGSSYDTVVDFTVDNIELNVPYTASAYFLDTQNGSVAFTDFRFQKGPEVTEYEPYTGGIPSPNPQYPQPINSAVSDQSDLDISVHNENLFNVYAITGADKGGGYRDGDTLCNPFGHYGNTSWFLGHSMRLEPGWYHISADCFTSTPETGQVIGMFVDPTKSPIVYSGNPAYLPISINIWTRFNWRVSIETAGEYYIRLTGGGNESNYDHLDVRFKNIMITKEISYDVYPPFEPYFNSSVTISGLSDIPLRAIGDQRDELIIDGGKKTVKHIQRITPMLLDPEADWYSNAFLGSLGIQAYQHRLSNLIQYSKDYPTAISTHFKYNKSIPSNLGPDAINNTVSPVANTTVAFRTDGLQTLEEFVAWYEATNPETYFILETPIETDLTDTEIGKKLLALSTGRGDLTLTITPPSGVNPKSVTLRYWKQKRPE